MTDELGEPVVLDTTVLSNFASSSSISDLLAVLATPATVPAVRKELQEGTNHGHEFIAVALEHVGEDMHVIQINSESKGRYSKFRTSLDLGETEALIGAIERRGRSPRTISLPVASLPSRMWRQLDRSASSSVVLPGGFWHLRRQTIS